MKNSIIEIAGQYFKVPEHKLINEGIVEAENGDFQVEFTISEGYITVSNAVNGYGNNARDDFKDEPVTVYRQV